VSPDASRTTIRAGLSGCRRALSPVAAAVGVGGVAGGKHAPEEFGEPGGLVATSAPVVVSASAGEM
jgi:hypothetical protein